MSWFIESEQKVNIVHECIVDSGFGIKELIAEIKKHPDYEILDALFNCVKVRHKSGKVLQIRHASEADTLKEAMDSIVKII